jgi:hypothetical protein
LLLKHWGCGFGCHSKHEHLSVFVLSCIGSNLAKGSFALKESYRLPTLLRNYKTEANISIAVAAVVVLTEYAYKQKTKQKKKKNNLCGP